MHAPLNVHWQHNFGLASICKKTNYRSNGVATRKRQSAWSGQAQSPAIRQPLQQQQPQQRRQPTQEPALKPERQQTWQQASAGSAISGEVLAATQAAVSAAVLPLQREVEQMKAACQGDAIESDSEEQDDEPKVMNVDAKHKRPLDPENNNVLRIRKPGQA